MCLFRLSLYYAEVRYMAERQGFEPWVGYDPYNRLAGGCLQPLGHLSINISYKNLFYAFSLFKIIKVDVYIDKL